MSLFTNPEIKKRWGPALKRHAETLHQGSIIIRQGQKFNDHYLIVQGSAEIYRQLSFKKLGLNAQIATLGPFDVICLNRQQNSKYTIRVKSHFLKFVKLLENQKQIVCIKAVNEWRKNRAQTLQQKFNTKILDKRPKQKQRKPLLKFIDNEPLCSKQPPNKSVTKLPCISKNNGSMSSRSATIIKDRKTPMCQDPQRLFGSVLRQYLSKRIDYQSSNIPLTICVSLQINRKDNKQNL